MTEKINNTGGGGGRGDCRVSGCFARAAIHQALASLGNLFLDPFSRVVEIRPGKQNGPCVRFLAAPDSFSSELIQPNWTRIRLLHINTLSSETSGRLGRKKAFLYFLYIKKWAFFSWTYCSRVFPGCPVEADVKLFYEAEEDERVNLQHSPVFNNPKAFGPKVFLYWNGPGQFVHAAVS